MFCPWSQSHWVSWCIPDVHVFTNYISYILIFWRISLRTWNQTKDNKVLSSKHLHINMNSKLWRLIHVVLGLEKLAKKIHECYVVVTFGLAVASCPCWQKKPPHGYYTIKYFKDKNKYCFYVFLQPTHHHCLLGKYIHVTLMTNYCNNKHCQILQILQWTKYDYYKSIPCPNV